MGEKETSLCSILKVSKKYRLIPTIDFDPRQYISKQLIQVGQYQASILSHLYELEGVKLQSDGKVLLMSIVIHFLKT